MDPISEEIDVKDEPEYDQVSYGVLIYTPSPLECKNLYLLSNFVDILYEKSLIECS